MRQESAQLTNELSQIGGLIEQTKSDVRRNRIQIEQQQRSHEDHVRRTKILSICLGALLVTLAAVLWLEYPTFRKNGTALIELSGLTDVVDTLGDRMGFIETQLRDSTTALPALMDRVDQLQTNLKSDLQTARNHTGQAVTEMGQQIREELNESMRAIQSRLLNLESNQHESHETVARLQKEIVGLREELAQVREQVSVSGEQLKGLQAEQKTSSSALAGMVERIASNETAVGTIANQVDRQRVDFQLPNKGTEQVAPGILLTVKRSDIQKKQIDGTLQLTAEGRSVPIREQVVQQPMTFYARGDSRPIELVLTDVASSGVSGYLLLPIPQPPLKSDE